MDFPSLQEPLKTALLAATRTTTHLCAEDLSFHRSLDPNGVAKQLDRHNARLLGLAERLLANAAAGADVVRPAPISLQDGDGDGASSSLEGSQWKSVVDVVDSLLERADMSLDEVRGVVRKAGVGQEVRCASRK
jgi:exosome complex exonuclease RRP6